MPYPLDDYHLLSVCNLTSKCIVARNRTWIYAEYISSLILPPILYVLFNCHTVPDTAGNDLTRQPLEQASTSATGVATHNSYIYTPLCSDTLCVFLCYFLNNNIAAKTIAVIADIYNSNP